jgi:cytochrome P450
MFALRDTLAANTLHALALIMSHPQVEARVRAELAGADCSSPEGIGGLSYLEACIDEAMRIWPTTAMLVRETLVDDSIAGLPVAAGTQVIIHNAFNHRNPDTVSEPDRYLPERWVPGTVDYRFNHMSNGAQSCAGRALALFLSKAVIAGLLADCRYRLSRPDLGSSRELPHVIDTYRVRLEVS